MSDLDNATKAALARMACDYLNGKVNGPSELMRLETILACAYLRGRERGEKGCTTTLQLGEDGVPVVFIETDESLEGDWGPKIRVRLNDAVIYPSHLYAVAKLRGVLLDCVNVIKGEFNQHETADEAHAILAETRGEKLGDVAREPEDVYPNDVLTDAVGPESGCVRGESCPVGCMNPEPVYHGVVSLHFAKLAEQLASELCVRGIDFEMKLAVALQNAATQAVRDALEPAAVLEVLQENENRALDDKADREALAASLYEELLDRWRKRY